MAAKSKHGNEAVLRVRALLAAALAGCLACAGNPQAEYPSQPPPGVTPVAEDNEPAPPGAIWRSDVAETVEAGLGYFLQRVDVEAEVLEGSFVGYRVVELHPPSWWLGIDLKPGDIVTRVNEMPIETPAEAHDVFSALPRAEQIVVAYLRGGEPRELKFRIVDKPGEPQPSPGKSSGAMAPESAAPESAAPESAAPGQGDEPPGAPVEAAKPAPPR